MSTDDEIISMARVDFRPIIQELLDFAATLESDSPDTFILTRPLLGLIKSKSEQSEEFLDAMGARNNRIWFSIRELVALLKNFSTAAYELIHIYKTARFNSLPNMEQFEQATYAQIQLVARLIFFALLRIRERLHNLGMEPSAVPFTTSFEEKSHITRLPRDRHPQDSSSVKHRVDYLSIHILNSTEEVNQFRCIARANPADWEKMDFDFLSEAKFRTMEVNMHVLQAMYDTYVSDSEVENQDTDLAKMRGRITAALHLLRVATIYLHFYERHIAPNYVEQDMMDSSHEFLNLFSKKGFAVSMIQYFATYLAQFLTDARSLCSTLLKKYCVNKTVEVKAPPYIGFHVRPSSLISAIVMHYGCDVEMRLGESIYDASVFANITMANNYLDQKKRAFITEKINEMNLSGYERQVSEGIVDRLTAVKEIILYLASLDLIRIYATHIKLDALPNPDDPSLKSQVIESIKFLMNNDRQVGIVFAATVTFFGPEQAVDDIAALANANYAESERGEDLPLPKQLDYLNFRRRTIKRPTPTLS